MTVRWIDEPVTSVSGVRWLGALGDLGRPKNVHARTVLAAWNQSQNYIMAGYPTLDDILQETWMYRDRRMLGTFTIWWNNAANPPLANWGQSPLPPPAWFSNGVQESDLTEQHLAALDTWATKSGSGLPTCIETCFAQAVGAPTHAQMQLCLNQCTCPPGLIWDEPTQGCVQPPVPGPLPPAPPPTTTPPATGPLPPAPPPIPAPTTASSTGTSSGMGLLIGGAIVLAAVAIFAATVGGSGVSAAKANPRRRRRKKRAAANPEEVPIANPCDAPGLLYGDRQTLFYWSLGAYGDKHVYVWADSYESAEEEMLEWVDDHAPGLLSTVGEEDYKNAAEELGVDWDPSEPDDEVIQKAEADMIMVSHTTLEHGNAIPSWEVHVNEVHGKKREAIKRLSQVYCEDEGPLPLPSGG